MEPFLNNGFNLAIWQSVGNKEYFIERLQIFEIGFAKILAPSFRNFQERWSIPAALSGIISFSNLKTRSSVTLENLNLKGS